MGEFKKQAIDMIEMAYRKAEESLWKEGYTGTKGDAIHAALTKEFIEIGPESFSAKYLTGHTRAGGVSTSIDLCGYFSTEVSRLRYNGPDGDNFVTVSISTPNGTAEIYFNDPDTVMKVMAALARAGSILGGKTDEHSDSSA